MSSTCEWAPSAAAMKMLKAEEAGAHSPHRIEQTPRQFAEAESITEIVCVQNHYNFAHRHDDNFIDALADKSIGYVPYFPLGGFTPLQSSTLNNAARSLNASS
jgi:aryl-alcohol dehydrogenase-like predicted oxidoreductase